MRGRRREVVDWDYTLTLHNAKATRRRGQAEDRAAVFVLGARGVVAGVLGV